MNDDETGQGRGRGGWQTGVGESRDEMRVEMRGENYATLNEDASSLLWHSLHHSPPLILSATKIRRTTDLSGQNFAVN